MPPGSQRPRAKSLARARILVVVLALLAAAPGLVTAALVSPTGPMASGWPSWVLPLWIGVFVVQVLLAIWLMQSLSTPSVAVFVLAFVGAATFAVNLSLGIGWLPALGTLVGVGAAAVWAYLTISAEYRIAAHGVPGTAVVLEVLQPRMNMIVNKLYVLNTMRVEVVRPDDGARYQSTLSGLFRIGREATPGDAYPVLIDPAKPERMVMDRS